MAKKISVAFGDNILTGIDTLELNIWVTDWLIDAAGWAELQGKKELSQSTLHDNNTGHIDINGVTFGVSRAGAKNYEYVLTNDDLTVFLSSDIKNAKNYPLARVIFRSQFLWSQNYLGAYAVLERWLEGICLWDKVQVSRVDLTADFVGSLPEWTPNQFVTYANRKGYTLALNFGSEALETYTIGRGNLLCRIYDKSSEIEKSGKFWFRDMWTANGWQTGQPVTRVEYQLRRIVLKEAKIDTFEDLVTNLGKLWKYCTHSWLTVRDPGVKGGKTRRNWHINSVWKIIQAIKITAADSVKRVRVRACNIDIALKQVVGRLAGLAALHTVNANHRHERQTNSQQPFNLKLGVYCLKRALRVIRTTTFEDLVFDKACTIDSLL